VAANATRTRDAVSLMRAASFSNRSRMVGNRCGGITYKFCARVEKMSSVAD